MTSSQPCQYTKGWVEFYKLKFKVTPDTLIPRPETELLVDEVLKYCKLSPVNCHLVLDLGTGAGNIAISIAKNSKNIRIIATDISENALKIARQNAKLHGVEKQIIFIQSNLLASKELEPLIHNTDPLILVTNLPYIPTARIAYLDSSVKDFEPHIALDGGEDGFELYRKLFRQISTPGVKSKLHPRGVRWKPKLIVGEIDYTHGELAVNEAQKYFPEAEIECRKDLAHLQRILLIRPLL